MDDDHTLAAGGEAPFSVVIPAHNEEAVIARCLRAFLDPAPAGARPQVIVAANGCSDRTVAIARAVAPDAIILDLPQGSKPLALNEGNARATAFPRFFLDADVIVDFAALEATAAVLRGGEVLAAAPAIRVDTVGPDMVVRAYHAVWQTQPYVRDAMIGSGLYGLSAAGMARIGTFPDIFADDDYVRTRFHSGERRSVAVDGAGRAVAFTVVSPRDFRSLIRIEGRRRAGDRQLRERRPPEMRQAGTGGRSLAGAIRAGTHPLAAVTYLGVKTAGRLLATWNRLRGTAGVWHRDSSSR